MSDNKLPTPYAVHHTHDGDVDYYTADQMRAYASEAVRAALAAQGEPVAWVVMNGLSKYQVCGAKDPADALCAEMQKRHDLSGSLASFHVQPLYTHPAPAASVQANGGDRVFLVATGEVYEGQETYTRHDIRPPMCDAEVLYTHPAPAASVSDAVAIVRERYRGTKWGKAAECICDAVDEAILALRPAQAGVPDDIVKDAQRYRWLRRKACVIGKTTYCGEETGQPILDFVNLPDVTEVISRDSATTLDAAIDAAIRARSKT